MEQERIQKQDYLKQEIIEKNYSPDEFMEYCESLKGAEIDAYTFEELEGIVKEFVCRKIANDEISVPETYVEPPVQSMRPEPRVEFTTKQSSESSAYSISAIKMHDNALSLEDIISVTVGE